MTKLTKRLLDVDKIIVTILVLLIFFDVFLQVISRILPSLRLSWSVQMGEVLLGALIWIGFSVGIKENAHVKFTIFTDLFSDNKKKQLEVLSDILFLTYLGILGVLVYKMIHNFFKLGRVDSLLQVNLGYLRLPMLFGVLFSIIVLIKKIITIFVGNRAKESK